jgi:tetratricopeptide (TPR) repeat protein
MASGCQEVHGPVWSPDGNLIAYTAYSRPAGQAGRIETALYLVDPEDQAGAPLLLDRNAAFPRWALEGPTLYFLGDRNKEGFYTSVKAHRPMAQRAGPGLVEPVLQDPSLRLVGLQVSVDGASALLCSARETRPGAPQTLEFWSPRDKTRASLVQLGEVQSAVLSPNGRVLAYSQKPAAPPDAKPFVALLELARMPLQPKVVFPTEQDNEPDAAGYLLHAFPDSERFLFYAPLGRNLWVARLDGGRIQKHPLPQGCSAPWMAAIAETGKSAALTLARAGGGRIEYDVFDLAFDKGAFRKLDTGHSEWLGGHARDPRPARQAAGPGWAWLSAAGLALGTPGKARYYPLTAGEHVAAVEAYLKQQQPDRALVAAQRARELQPPPEDLGQLGRLEARAQLKLGAPARAADAYVRALLLHPVTGSGLPWVLEPAIGLPSGLNAMAALKEMDGFLAAAPEDKLLIALRQAFAKRIEGQPAAALALCKQAAEAVPSEDMLAGVKFQQALAAFENGDMGTAGENWASAARCPGFPQADYAAGLSAVAYRLDSRPNSAELSDKILRVGTDRQAPLREDLLRVPRDLTGRAYRQKRVQGEDIKSPDQTLRVWVEVTEYSIPQATLRPSRMHDAEWKPVERRVGAVRRTLSELKLAAPGLGTQTLARIPFAITQPVFSPSGQALAFLARGDVFPVGEACCEVYVVGVSGAILAGNTEALASGQLSSRTIISSVQWNGPQSLVAAGTQVDIWGGQTGFQKSVAVGR